MNYLEALKRVEGYSYLKEQEITNRKSGKKSTVDYITLLPTEGIKEDTHKWLNPRDGVYAAFLLNKDCEIVFILDFIPNAMFKGSMLLEYRIKEYYLSSSNDPSLSINPIP